MKFKHHQPKCGHGFVIEANVCPWCKGAVRVTIPKPRTADPRTFDLVVSSDLSVGEEFAMQRALRRSG